LSDKPHSNCVSCGLKDGTFVPSEIPKYIDPGKKTIWIVGEAPGAEEEKRGKPFVGRSGRLLRSVLREFGILKDCNVVITNACLCRPENNRTPKASEIRACRWHLEVLKEKLPPALILACGATAAKALGIRCSIERDRGTTFETEFGTVLVTYHPAAVLRDESQRLLTLFRNDVRKFRTLINERVDDDKEPSILIPKTTDEIRSSLKELFSLAESERYYVSFDVETLPIPWDTESVAEQIREFGLDMYNPYSGLCTIAFAAGDKVIAIPYRLKEKLEFMLNRQVSLQKELFGKVLSDQEYKLLMSLLRKTPETLTQQSANRTYRQLFDILPELKDYALLGSSDKLWDKLERLKKEVLLSYSTLQLVEEELSKYKAEFDVDEKAVSELLVDFALNPNIWKIAHNAKFEYKVFWHEFGVELRGLKIDTMLLAYLLDENMKGFYNLESLVSMYMPSWERYKMKYLSKSLLEYNAMDAYLTLKLAKRLVDELKSRPAWESKRLVQANKFLLEEATPLLAKVEYRGFYCDTDILDYIDSKSEEIQEEVLDLIESLVGTRDVNKKAFKTLFYSLYEGEPITTEKGELSLSRSAIQTVYSTTENPDLKKLSAYLLTYKKFDKIRNTYVVNYKKLINPYSGRIHPNFNLTGTATGRLSSSNPNFQNIPRDPVVICPECKVIPVGDEPVCPICGTMSLEKVFHLKSVVSAPEGYIIVAADYSQMEVRVLAEFTQDPNLMKVIEDGIDLHSYMASKIYGIPYEEIRAKKDTDEYIAKLRQNAKSATFGVIYGQTPQGLAESKGIPLEEAERIINTFYEEFPKVKSWIATVHSHVREYKRYYTPLGRFRRFVEVNSKALRESQNFPIQSYASDITLAAACEIQRKLERIGGHVIGLVHDSIEAEVPEDRVEEACEIFRYCMIDYVREKFNLKVPIKIDIEVGRNWGETEEV